MKGCLLRIYNGANAMKKQNSIQRQGSHFQSGFSIVELLIVILVISILVGLAGLTIVRYRRSVEADVVATDVSQMIRRIRERALDERVTYRLRFVPGSAVAGVKGDTYYLERFPASPADPSTDPANPKAQNLPKGWRFAKSPAASAAPDPYNLPEVSYSYTGGQCAILFKGDGILGDGNAITTPTSNINTPPLNRTIFLYDAEEPGAYEKQNKPRAITVIGNTGRTSVWKLTGGSEWRLPGQR